MKNSYLNKSIFVTGASGFIGSRLINRLYEMGIEVHALSRKHSIKSNNNIHWHVGDLTNYEETEKILQLIKPDFIFHLASEVTGKRELDLVLPTLNNNFISAVHILTAATKISCDRIVLAGSLEEPDYREPLSIPSSPYAAAKWASSGYARMFNALYATPVITTRIFMVYGPGQFDLNKLIPYVILSLLRGKSPKLSSGRRPVDWIFVDDVVQGLLMAAITKNTERQSFDIGSGNLVTTFEIVEMIMDLINTNITPEFNALAERPLEQVRVANTNNENKIPEWTPNYSLEEGLKITIDWYRKLLDSGEIC